MPPYDLVTAFKEKFKKNIMTPRIVSFRTKGNRVVELSSGTGLEHEPIYGVTVKDYDNKAEGWTDPNLSQMFYSKEEAKKHADMALKDVV